MSPTITSNSIQRAEGVSSRERVGAFETLDGAARAVTRLVELDYDPASVAIAPREFAVVEPARLRDRIGPAVLRNTTRAVTIVSAAVIVVSLGIDNLVGVVLPAAILAAVAGAAVGLIAAIRQQRRARFLTMPGKAPELRPATFDVVVDRAGVAARHDLACWWDPAAPPVQRAA